MYFPEIGVSKTLYKPFSRFLVITGKTGGITVL
jgi:hypothetical protein